MLHLVRPILQKNAQQSTTINNENIKFQPPSDYTSDNSRNISRYKAHEPFKQYCTHLKL